MVTGFPGGTEVHNLPVNPREAGSIKLSSCQCKRCRFDPWVGKIPWRRKWQPTPVFLPGESHGQRSLESYSPWAHRTEHAFTRMVTQPSPRLRVCGNPGFVRSLPEGFWKAPGIRQPGCHLSGLSLPTGGSVLLLSLLLLPPHFALHVPSEIWLGGLPDMSRGRSTNGQHDVDSGEHTRSSVSTVPSSPRLWLPTLVTPFLPSLPSPGP